MIAVRPLSEWDPERGSYRWWYYASCSLCGWYSDLFGPHRAGKSKAERAGVAHSSSSIHRTSLGRSS